MIEETLSKLIPDDNVPWASLYKACRYTLLNVGKRIRPKLVLAATEALGGDTSFALHPAAAIECLHTYSLIHDDLPAMDNDDFRRGKPSLHRAFPEGHAILAGDYLLTRAFEILAHAPKLTEGQKIALIQTLAKDGGDLGMIGGQILDLEASHDDISMIHSLKTAKLFACSAEFGAIIASHPARNEMRQFGEKLGLAFQMLDDILDADKQEKVTILKQLGIKEAKKEAEQLIKEAEKILQTLDCNPDPLLNFASSLFDPKTTLKV
jgi:geranylgeranyl diphosphate synthase type II